MKMLHQDCELFAIIRFFLQEFEKAKYYNFNINSYFETLIENYEQSMVIFKQQIDDLERHLMSTTEQMAPLTAQG